MHARKQKDTVKLKYRNEKIEVTPFGGLTASSSLLPLEQLLARRKELSAGPASRVCEHLAFSLSGLAVEQRFILTTT